MSSPPCFVAPSVDLAGIGALGRVLAATLSGGDVVLLVGDLGAGKTTFTKSVAAALGVEHEVTSPTFTIAHGYETTSEGVRMLMHLDAYRLTGADDLEAVGLFDALDEGAVALIEWGDIVADAFTSALTVLLEHVDDDHRRVSLACDAGTWSQRMVALARSIGAESC